MDVEETVACRNCGAIVPEVSYVMHVGHCERHHTKCLLCSEQVDERYLQNHIDQVHEIVCCDKCGEEFERGIARDHASSICVNRKVQCSVCHYQTTAVHIEEHRELCLNRTEKCHRCKHPVKYKYIDSHELACPGTQAKSSIQRDGEQVLSDTVPCKHCHAEVELKFLETHQCGNLACKNLNQREGEAIFLPCELCNKLFPIDVHQTHEAECSQKQKIELTTEHEEVFTIPCEFCHLPLPSYGIEAHQNYCLTTQTGSHHIQGNAVRPKQADYSSGERRWSPKHLVDFFRN